MLRSDGSDMAAAAVRIGTGVGGSGRVAAAVGRGGGSGMHRGRWQVEGGLEADPVRRRQLRCLHHVRVARGHVAPRQL